jgi:SAM-dependent methyltransferase
MESYVHGHHGAVVASHSTRSVADSAAFVLGRLEPHHRLLDVGCGPGSISLDLASRVRWVVGVDAAAEAIEAADAARVAAAVDNVEFAIGDAYALDFPDASFDVVFAHQVLQHLARPVDALREMRRVLVPGGVVAVRDADYGTMVHSPHDDRLDRWLALYHDVARRYGGDADAGRHLGAWSSEAGFVDLVVTTSTWTYWDPARVTAWRDLWVSRLLEARLGESAIAMNLADRATVEEIAEGWRAWAASPTPFFAFLHGEVVATAP